MHRFPDTRDQGEWHAALVGALLGRVRMRCWPRHAALGRAPPSLRTRSKSRGSLQSGCMPLLPCTGATRSLRSRCWPKACGTPAHVPPLRGLAQAKALATVTDAHPRPCSGAASRLRRRWWLRARCTRAHARSRAQALVAEARCTARIRAMGVALFCTTRRLLRFAQGLQRNESYSALVALISGCTGLHRLAADMHGPSSCQ